MDQFGSCVALAAPLNSDPMAGRASLAIGILTVDHEFYQWRRAEQRFAWVDKANALAPAVLPRGRSLTRFKLMQREHGQQLQRGRMASYVTSTRPLFVPPSCRKSESSPMPVFPCGWTHSERAP